jgi:subtilase family serine protease
MRKVRAIALTAGAGALSAAVVGAMSTAVPAATTGQGTPSVPSIVLKPGVRQVPNVPTRPTPWTTALCESQLKVACYEPTQLRAAYNLAPLYNHGIDGTGSTIVIVDSFGSPTIQNDLTVFDKQYGFPDPPSFKIIQPAGPVTSEDPGWAGETTLDVEYAHTVAPGANIVLAETPDAETEGITGFPNMIKSEEAVIDHPERYGITGKVTVISQSFGATEETFTSYAQLASVRGAYTDAARHGVTVLAATGDQGASSYQLNGTDFYTTPVTDWPASDPLVTAVGGTEIKESASGTYSQVVWNDTFDASASAVFGTGPLGTGGGVSEYFKLPAYQRSVAGTIAAATGARASSSLPRAIPDISMSGACNGAMTFYYSFPGAAAGWHLVCGTSEATPLFAGIVALSAQVAHHPLGLINPRLYELSAHHAPGLVDITSGNNTVAFSQGNPPVPYTVPGYPAGPGYDLASGVGTVNAALFVPELAGFGH